MILEKLHKAGNENEALEMLTNAILGGHTNVVQLTMVKTLQELSKKEYAESTYDRLKRERDDRLKRERDDYKWEHEESSFERRQREKQEREGYQEPEIEDDPNDNFPF